ncbi:MAG: hypothetical protein ABJL99_07030 [Aliishimia sp.]
MTMIKLEQKIKEQEELLEIARGEVRRLMKEIIDFRKTLESPNGDATSSKVPEIKNLGTLVKSCIEVEKQLGKCEDERAGIAQCGVAFDLRAARDSIGCKLDSLRRCCD